MIAKTYLRHVLIASLLFGVADVRAADDWEQTMEWVDKYPSDEVAARRGGLFDQVAVKSGLKAMLPKAEAHALTIYSIESRVQRVGDYVIANKCLPHNCPNEMAMLVVDTNGKRMWVGFFSRRERKVSTRWYGTSEDYSVLPDEIKKQFVLRHGD